MKYNKHSIYSFFFFALLIVFTKSSLSFGQDLSTTLFNQGMQLYAKQDWSGAADYLGQVCDMNPEFHQARYYLIYSLLALKQQAKALEHANILCAKNPQNREFAELRDKIAAARHPSRPVAQQPIQKEVVFGGYSYSDRSGEPPSKAASAPSKAPAAPASDLEIAIGLIDTEQFASAAELLDSVIKKDPKNYRALHYRGVAELNLKQFQKAREWFEKALAVKSDNFETLFLLGDTCLKSNEPKKAEEAFNKALKIRPNDVFAMLNLADAKRRQGANKEAIEIYTRVKELDPNILEARLAIAETLVDEGKLDEAANTVNEVLASDSKNVQAHFLKGKILYRNNLIEDAISELRLALQGRPDDVYIKIWLAKVLLSSYKVADALDVAAQILKQDPNNYEARLLTAEALITNGEIADAKEHLDQAEKLQKSPELTRLRALLARKSGNNDEARSYYSLYIQQDPKNGYAMLEYADFLQEINEPRDALSILKSVKADFAGTSLEQIADTKIETLEAKLSPGGSGATANPNAQPGKVRY